MSTSPSSRRSRRRSTSTACSNGSSARRTTRPPASVGPSGENLLRLLELRLDNIVYRAGWASTRPQARQFVNHGLINVNGKRVDIPSYRGHKGDIVSLSPKAKGMIVIQHNIDVLDRNVVGWLEAGDGGKQVTVRDLPQREHIDVPVREQLIVELYSK